jgi:general secretion pathway protein J
MMRARAAAGGFTLLEVLVAVGIFAVFSAMAYTGLTRLLETRARLAAEQEFWRRLALAFVQVEDDLAQARVRTVRDNFGNPRAAFRGQPVDPRATAEPSLELTRAGLFVLGAGPRSQLARVGYRLRDGRLLRLTWPALDAPPVAAARETPVLEAVDSMELRFRAPGGWVDRWPPEGQGAAPALPVAVEMTLTLGERGRYTRLFLVNR